MKHLLMFHVISLCFLGDHSAILSFLQSHIEGNIIKIKIITNVI